MGNSPNRKSNRQCDINDELAPFFEKDINRAAMFVDHNLGHGKIGCFASHSRGDKRVEEVFNIVLARYGEQDTESSV